ncbi:MAG: class I SAM-dependent methyltransferase [Deltaproteobacteria bacterium]|nr:class I SAM-dependent methyltransferase [Deltaproteobacteria bacterium]
MSWLLARVYDRMMAAPEEACLRTWRAELLTGVSGEVLEVGAGTGASLAAYGAGVTRLVLTEPDPAMRARLDAAVASARPRATVLAAPAHALPFADASFDVVASFLVLCSVADASAALCELRRVLRPTGRLVFLEHVAAQANPRRLAWQHRVTPLWRLAAGNCHLARDTAAAIEGAGFVIEELRRESIRKAMPLARPSIRGWARRG